jgi:hypothetical protein
MSTNAYTKLLKIITQATLALGTAALFSPAQAQDDDRAIDRYRNKNRPVYRLYKGQMNEELDRAKLNLPSQKSKVELKSNPFAGIVKDSGNGPEGDFVPDEFPIERAKPKPLITASDFQMKEDTKSSFEDPRFDEETEQGVKEQDEILDLNNMAEALIGQELDGVVVENGEFMIEPLAQDEELENGEPDPNADPNNPDAEDTDWNRNNKDEEEEIANGFQPALSNNLANRSEERTDDLTLQNIKSGSIEINPAENNQLGAVVRDNSLVIGERANDQDNEEVLLSRSQKMIDGLVNPHKEAFGKRTERTSGFDRLVNSYEEKTRSMTARYLPGNKGGAETESAVVKVSQTDQSAKMGLLRDSTQFNADSRTLNGTIAFQPATRFQPTGNVDFQGKNPLGTFGSTAGFNPTQTGTGLTGNFGGISEPTPPGILRLPNTALNPPSQPRVQQAPLFGGGNPATQPSATPSFRESRREGLRIESNLGGMRQSFPLGSRGF